MSEPFIETWSGKRFEFLNPKRNQICLGDIANTLAGICRYNGNARRHYSVAEHSVLLADYALARLGCTRQEARTVLMHDAAEAYIGDIPGPIKPFVPEFRGIEDAIMLELSRAFNLIHPIPDWIKDIDRRIVSDERSQLLADSGNVWPTDDAEPLGVALPCWRRDQAVTAFTNKALMLGC